MLILASGKAYQFQVIHRKVEVAWDPEHDKTNKMTCAQRILRSAWAAAQSDQS